jgi:hypothetical protein
MTLWTKGMGAIIKSSKKIKRVGKEERKQRLEFLKGQRNIYKKDPTGKKDKIIKSMNETLKRKKHSASPGMIDHYHKVMTSDFVKKTGPYFDHPKVKKAYQKSLRKKGKK